MEALDRGLPSTEWSRFIIANVPESSIERFICDIPSPSIVRQMDLSAAELYSQKPRRSHVT